MAPPTIQYIVSVYFNIILFILILPIPTTDVSAATRFLFHNFVSLVICALYIGVQDLS